MGAAAAEAWDCPDIGLAEKNATKSRTVITPDRLATAAGQQLETCNWHHSRDLHSFVRAVRLLVARRVASAACTVVVRGCRTRPDRSLITLLLPVRALARCLSHPTHRSRSLALCCLTDEVSAVVVDIGTSSTKSGYAGEDCPKFVIPSVRAARHRPSRAQGAPAQACAHRARTHPTHPTRAHRPSAWSAARRLHLRR